MKAANFVRSNQTGRLGDMRASTVDALLGDLALHDVDKAPSGRLQPDPFGQRTNPNSREVQTQTLDPKPMISVF